VVDTLPSTVGVDLQHTAFDKQASSTEQSDQAVDVDTLSVPKLLFDGILAQPCSVARTSGDQQEQQEQQQQQQQTSTAPAIQDRVPIVQFDSRKGEWCRSGSDMIFINSGGQVQSNHQPNTKQCPTMIRNHRRASSGLLGQHGHCFPHVALLSCEWAGHALARPNDNSCLCKPSRFADGSCVASITDREMPSFMRERHQDGLEQEDIDYEQPQPDIEHAIAAIIGPFWRRLPGHRVPNIVLISVDTLRADALHVYDAHTLATRAERIEHWLRARNGIVFDSCSATAPWTRPSHAAMLSGQHPSASGIMDPDHRIKVPTIAALLANEFGKRVGFVENANICPDLVDAEALLAASKSTKIHPNLWSSFGWSAGWSAYDMVPDGHVRAADFVREHARSPSPWFVFYHTNLMHDAGTQYLDAMQQLDHYVDTLLEAVNFDNTVVILTSDHGEGFDVELNRTHHGGRVHQDLLHVPLMLWMPTYLERLFVTEKTRVYEADHIRRVATPASGLDIVPTLLHLIGYIATDKSSSSSSSSSMASQSAVGIAAMPHKATIVGGDSAVDHSAFNTPLKRWVSHYHGASLLALPPNRHVYSVDTAYCYWPGESTRTFTNTGATWKMGGQRAQSVRVISDMLYPLKFMYYNRDGMHTDMMYNLAYDPAELHDLYSLHERLPHAGGLLVVLAGTQPGLPWPVLASPVIYDAMSQRHQQQQHTSESRHMYPPILMLPYAYRDVASTLELLVDALQTHFAHNATHADLFVADTTIVIVRATTYLPLGWLTRLQRTIHSMHRSRTPWDVLTFAGLYNTASTNHTDHSLTAAAPLVVGRWNDLGGYHHHPPSTATSTAPTLRIPFAPKHATHQFAPTRVQTIVDGGWMAFKAPNCYYLQQFHKYIAKRRLPTPPPLAELRLGLLDVADTVRAFVVDNHVLVDVSLAS
jgi:hypothetical protein